MINFRYIKTKVDNNNVILQFTSCNTCPLMKFNKNDLNVVCSFCVDKIIESVNGYSVYSEGSVPITKVNIPKWCHLSDNLMDSQQSNYIYSKYNFNQYYIEYDDKTLPVINHNIIELDDTHYKFKIKNEYKHIIEKYIFNNDNTDNKNEKIKKEIILNKCSCCGQNKEKINRYENLGMCDKCWEENKKNNFTKYFSYINNFRLKRNKDWIDKNFNKIDINFNIK